MTRSDALTRTVEISEAKNRLSPLANEVSRHGLRIIVAESGAPIAALVSLDDLERLARIDRERESLFAVVDRMRAAFADVSTEEIEREVAKALAEVRAESAKDREARAPET
ncbi:MAG: type II toxin-antitoxin system prevent-host-death family antitoxin [Thermomicrobiales bacterium]